MPGKSQPRAVSGPIINFEDKIGSQSRPNCFLCGTPGQPLYQGLKDRLFGVWGEWNYKRCPNPECGLVWLDPTPLEEDISKAYLSYYTHQEPTRTSNERLPHPRSLVYQLAKKGYLSQWYGYRFERLGFWQKVLARLICLDPGLRASLDFSVMYLPSHCRGLLLDVGCGSGWLLKNMQELGWQVEGVDFDAAAVQNAKSRGLSVRQGSLEAQQYPEDHFDAVTLCHLIEHVHAPLALLRECYRIIKPGGRLVVITPNIGSLGHKWFNSSWRGLEPPRHLNIFSTTALLRLTEHCPFKEIDIRTTIRDAKGLLQASWNIRHKDDYRQGINICHKTMRIWTWGLELAEWGIMRVRPLWGEEIALIAEK